MKSRGSCLARNHVANDVEHVRIDQGQACMLVSMTLEGYL